jgi:hypothetical protein
MLRSTMWEANFTYQQYVRFGMALEHAYQDALGLA